MPLKLCLHIHKILHSYRTTLSLLMSNHLIPYLLLLSLEASGSSPLCQSKHLIWNLLSTLGFFYPALREGAAETLRSEKNQTHFWTCVR